MKTSLTVGLAVSLLTPSAGASDPVGIYALVDKVVLEPDPEHPQRIQVWGAFSRAKSDPRRNAYEPPARGYLYFTTPTHKNVSPEILLAEWSDLKKVAGTGQAVGFGARSRSADHVRLRKAAEKPEKPDEYPVGFGLTKLRKDTLYRPVSELFLLPGPEAPLDGQKIEPGKVVLVARNIHGGDREKKGALKYLFEIESSTGDKEASPPIEPGEKETRWAPRMEAKAGRKYTWRVWVTGEDLTGPVALAVFEADPAAKAVGPAVGGPGVGGA